MGTGGWRLFSWHYQAEPDWKRSLWHCCLRAPRCTDLSSHSGGNPRAAVPSCLFYWPTSEGEICSWSSPGPGAPPSIASYSGVGRAEGCDGSGEVQPLTSHPSASPPALAPSLPCSTAPLFPHPASTIPCNPLPVSPRPRIPLPFPAPAPSSPALPTGWVPRMVPGCGHPGDLGGHPRCPAGPGGTGSTGVTRGSPTCGGQRGADAASCCCGTRSGAAEG